MEPAMVMTTHKHHDHSGGNIEMREIFPNIQILGGANDNVPGATRGLENEEKLTVGDLQITCYHTPCHTRGHMLYLFEEAGVGESMDHVSGSANGYQVNMEVNRCVFTGAGVDVSAQCADIS